MFTIKKDTSKQVAGTWKAFGGGDSRFLIAHTSNLRFQRKLNSLQAPYRKKIEKGTLDPKISRDILCEAMADGLLLDWENVALEDGGDPIAYTPELGKQALLCNEDLREFVSEIAADLENFRNEEIKAQGNS